MCVCGAGNYETLSVEPDKRNIDVSGLLREFFTRHYLAQHMSLVVLSKGVNTCLYYRQTIACRSDMKPVCYLTLFTWNGRLS